MGGTASAEIDAPLEEVWAVVEDVLTAPDWQGGLVAVSALERDSEGRPTLVESSWLLEDLGGKRTRATYTLDGDPGRVLGMLIRGPVEAAARAMLVNARPGELKTRVEGSDR